MGHFNRQGAGSKNRFPKHNFNRKFQPGGRGARDNPNLMPLGTKSPSPTANPDGKRMLSNDYSGVANKWHDHKQQSHHKIHHKPAGKRTVFNNNNGKFGGESANKTKSFQPYRKKRPLLQPEQQESRMSDILSDLDAEVLVRSKLGRRAPTNADLQRWKRKQMKLNQDDQADSEGVKNNRWKKMKCDNGDNDTELEVVPSDFKGSTANGGKQRDYNSDSDDDAIKQLQQRQQQVKKKKKKKSKGQRSEGERSFKSKNAK